DTKTFAFGAASLKVETPGRRKNEGIRLSEIAGIRPDSPYTFSLYAQIPHGLNLWLYADEYDQNNHWNAYSYRLVKGHGKWRRYLWTWVTASRTNGLILYVLTASKAAASFVVDDVQ